jgi:hypothetical protein
MTKERSAERFFLWLRKSEKNTACICQYMLLFVIYDVW